MAFASAFQSNAFYSRAFQIFVPGTPWAFGEIGVAEQSDPMGEVGVAELPIPGTAAVSGGSIAVTAS